MSLWFYCVVLGCIEVDAPELYSNFVTINILSTKTLYVSLSAHTDHTTSIW